MKVDLNGKTAVVTGGSGVLCSEMARALAENGARVAVLARRMEAVQAVADEINAAGGQALAVTCDVLDKASLETACEKIEKALGPADILVNGAGGNRPEATTSIETHAEVEEPDERSFFDLTPEGVNGTMELNFTGSMLACQVFAKSMAGRGDPAPAGVRTRAGSRPPRCSPEAWRTGGRAPSSISPP